ncbi:MULTISPECIES: hypothetical protein [Aerosakkonema]
MNDESMNHKLERDESEAEDMLEEYDFSVGFPSVNPTYENPIL